MQAALEKELAEAERQARDEETSKKSQPAQPQANGGDAEMAGTDDAATSTAATTPAPATTTGGKAKAGEDEEEGSDAESEDLEAESSGSEDEDEEEGDGEGEGDDDVEMGEDGEAKGTAASNTKGQKSSGGVNGNASAEVMVH